MSNTTDLFIVGAGGFAREVLELVREINRNITLTRPLWNPVFIDSNPDSWGTTINGAPVVGDETFLEKYIKENSNRKPSVVVGIGNPKIKRKIVEKLADKVIFPNLIHPSVINSTTNKYGEGNIITAGCILTCNIEIKNHVMINLACTVGHDVVINDYVVISPGVNVSGNVNIGTGAYLGTGSTILEKKNIGDWSIVGGSALVNKDIPENCTAVGVPAKVISKSPD